MMKSEAINHFGEPLAIMEIPQTESNQILIRISSVVFVIQIYI